MVDQTKIPTHIIWAASASHQDVDWEKQYLLSAYPSQET
jgi:hypothetical protein